MTLPIHRVPGSQAAIERAICHKDLTSDVETQIRSRPVCFFAALGKCSSLLVLGLLLISCEQVTQSSPSPSSPSSQFSQQSAARRRAVQPSQRREARMARPVSQTGQPRVDYGPYKQIQPEMMLAEVEAILGGSGQYYELNASTSTTEKVGINSISNAHSVGHIAAQQQVSEGSSSEALFWRWTHPSQAYNIHLRLKKAGAESDGLAVHAKWLTYNPPGPNTVADARDQD